MEFILWIVFGLLSTVGFFLLFHLNLDSGLYSNRKNGLNFDFDNLFMTAFKASAAMLLGGFFGRLMVAAWPFFLVVFCIIGVGIGIAYALKRFSNTFG